MTSSTRNGTPNGPRMRAIVQDSYGSSDVLRLDEFPVPTSRTTRCWSACTPPASTAGPGT